MYSLVSGHVEVSSLFTGWRGCCTRGHAGLWVPVQELFVRTDLGTGWLLITDMQIVQLTRKQESFFRRQLPQIMFPPAMSTSSWLTSLLPLNIFKSFNWTNLISDQMEYVFWYLLAICFSHHSEMSIPVFCLFYLFLFVSQSILIHSDDNSVLMMCVPKSFSWIVIFYLFL